MTKVQRIGNILSALIMIAFAALLFYMPGLGLKTIAIVLSVTFTLRGFQTLMYYFSIARHMVGGRSALYRGIIMLDAGLFTGSVVDNSAYIIILYIAGLHAFAGLVDILRSRESKALGASWRLTMASGASNVLLAVMVIVSGMWMHQLLVAVYVYAAGLIYSAILRIASVFRRSAIVYIQ